MRTIYKKVHLSANSPSFQYGGFFVNLRPVAEGGQSHPALLGGGGAGQFSGLPSLVDAVEVLRQGLWWPPEAHPPGLGGGNALGLALSDVHPLVFRHEGEDLKDDVR